MSTASNNTINQVSLKRLYPENAQAPAMLIVSDASISLDSLTAALADHFNCFTLTADPFSVEEGITGVFDQLVVELKDMGERWLTCMGVGPYASFVQLLAKRHPKIVRRAIFLDGTTSLEPTATDKLLSRIESLIPVGLPLRTKGLRFDSRSIVHRLHCPCLVLLSSMASPYAVSQSNFLHERIPNSLLARVGNENFYADIAAMLVEFEKVPAKLPQKNLKRQAVVNQ